MIDDSIEKSQKKLIIFANKNKKNHYKKYDESNYLNTWLSNLGNFYLKKKFLNLSFLENLKLLFFLFYKKNVAQNYKFYEILNYDRKLKKKYQNLIISFKSNDTDFDSHFSSKRMYSKNSLWFLINLSDNYEAEIVGICSLVDRSLIQNNFKYEYKSLLELPIESWDEKDMPDWLKEIPITSPGRSGKKK